MFSMVLIVLNMLFFINAEDNYHNSMNLKYGGIDGKLLKVSISDRGVEYEQKVLNYFNNQTLVEQIISEGRKESKFLKIIDDRTWVHISVDVRDTSNVIISYKEDSIEVQEMKDRQKEEIIGGIIDSVLSTLSEDEFKVKNTRVGFSGFSGNITEEGMARNIFIRFFRRVGL